MPASPPRLLIPQGLATGSMTHAVTSSVIYRQQLENGAATPSPHDQEDNFSGRQSPGSEQDAEELERTLPGAVAKWTLVETHTWAELEGAVWQSVRGTSEGAMAYALAILDQIRTDVEERFWSQTGALQAGRQKGEEFGCPDQLQGLLGQTRYLWEWNIALQLQVLL